MKGLVKIIFRAQLVFFMALKTYTAVGQCTDCSTVLVANSGNTINVSAGQTLCINSGVTYTGDISLSGGVICNNGTITSISLKEGTFNNYGLFVRKGGGLDINTNNRLVINNFKGSTFAVENSINIESINNSDTTLINLYEGSLLSTGEDFNINKGALVLNINVSSIRYIDIGATPKTRDGTDRVAGIGYDSEINRITAVNVGGQFNVMNSGLVINNHAGGALNVRKAFNLEGKRNKLLNNYGIISLNNSLNIIGNGHNMYSVTINNFNTFNITNFLSSSYNNGAVTINNTGFQDNTTERIIRGSKSVFSVSKSVTLNKENNNINNNSVFNITQDLIVNKGNFINNGKITARDYSIKQGAFTNNNTADMRRDLVINADGTVNNNSFMNVGRDFNNKGKVNTALSTLIQTNNYYNIGTGNITSTVNPSDTSTYPKIIIFGYSENSAYTNGRMIIFDQSLQANASNTDYGFDLVSNASRISSNVQFAAKAVGPGNPPVIVCQIKKNIYSVGLIASPSLNPPVCQEVNLTTQLQIVLTAISFPSGTPVSFTVPVNNPGISYNWQPNSAFTNPSSQFQTVSPNAPTTYTVVIIYLGCIYTKVFTITPGPNTLTSALPANAVKCSSAPIALNATASGGVSPYQYIWSPSNSLSPGGNNAIQNANPSSATAYNVTVKDALGCTKVFAVNVQISNITAANLLSFYNICYGSSATLDGTATLGQPPYSYVWTPATNLVPAGNNPIQTASPPSNLTYNLQITDGLGCTKNYAANIIVSPQITINPPITFYSNIGVPVMLGVTPLVSGGIPPFIYAWTGPSAFSSSSQNPFVSLSSSTANYNLTVNDAVGCSQSQVFTVIAITADTYSNLKKQEDAGHYKIINNNLLFTIDGEYNGTPNLSYKIYDINHTPVTGTLPTLVLNNGDNRYQVNLTPFSLVVNEFYTLEVVNEKSEVFLLKFRR